MRFSPKHVWLLAFTAVFAVLAGFVFWGAWAPGSVPVMPDCPTSFSIDHSGDFCRSWLLNGKFVPGDLVAFLDDPYFWVELKYVLALFFAAFAFSYFLTGRGLSRFAAYSAGLFLAFCGYWCTLFSAGHLGWFQWMTYGVFAFGLIDRMLEKGRLRHSIMLGAVLAWGSFYQPDLWLVFTLFTGFYFVFRSIMVRPGWKTWALRSLIALAVFIAIGLPSFRSAIFSDLAGRDKQIEEGQTLTGDSLDHEETRWRFVTNWSMPPEDTKEFVAAGIHGDTSCRTTLAIGKSRGVDVKPYEGRLGRPLMPDGEEAPEGNYRQHSLYVGWVACIFALLGVASLFFKGEDQGKRLFDRRATIVFFLAAGLLFWVFSMGRYVECVYRCVFALPFGDYLRAPVKWHHLTEFCIVVLAAYGLHFAWRIVSRYGIPGRAILVAVALYGAYDLASEAKKFCAPHTADTIVAPLPQPMPDAKSDREAFLKEVRNHNLKPISTMTSSGRMSDGSIKDFEILWVEQKSVRPRPTKRDYDNELKGLSSVMATCSAAITVLALLYLLASLLVKRIDRMKV